MLTTIVSSSSLHSISRTRRKKVATIANKTWKTEEETRPKCSAKGKIRLTLIGAFSIGTACGFVFASKCWKSGSADAPASTVIAAHNPQSNEPGEILKPKWRKMATNVVWILSYLQVETLW